MFIFRVTFPDMLDLNHFVIGDTGLGGEEGGDKPSSGVDDSSTTDSGSALDAEDASLENTSASLPESDNQVYCGGRWYVFNDGILSCFFAW